MSKNIYTFHYTYLITNTNTQMKYIGVRSCTCLPENDGYMGSSKILGEALNKNPEYFTKTIIDTFPTREIANTNEQWFHETYDVARNSEFYNLCIAPMGFCKAGKLVSEETRKKMSNARNGKIISSETRAKLSYANRGEKNGMYGRTHSKETRKKLSNAVKGEKHPMYGKTFSEETRKKMSVAIKKSITPERRKKMSEIQKGKKHSAETRAKISAANSGKKHPMYGKPVSEEHRKNISNALKGKTRKKITCPHCNKTGGDNNMKRWHFDNCKKISTKSLSFHVQF